jgi:hypothetical protein
MAVERVRRAMLVGRARRTVLKHTMVWTAGLVRSALPGRDVGHRSGATDRANVARNQRGPEQ